MVGEYSVTVSEMDRIAGRIGVSATERAVHPLMLMAADIDAHVTVQNQTIKVNNGNGLAYCDAPTSVEVAFGVVGRKVFLLREAAADPCVRRALLDHYGEHSRALDTDVAHFITQHRDKIGARLHELKQTAASDPASANKAFEVNLWPIVQHLIGEFKKQIKSSRERTISQIDSIKHLKRLRNECGGKINEMEQKNWPH
jgi:hypothetical protein